MLSKDKMDVSRDSWPSMLERNVSSMGSDPFWATCSPTTSIHTRHLPVGLVFQESPPSRSSEAPAYHMMLWQFQRLRRWMSHRGEAWGPEAESCRWRGDSSAHMGRKSSVWCFLCSCPPQGTDSGLGFSGNGGSFTVWPIAPSPSGSLPKLTHTLDSLKRVDTYVGSRTGSWLRCLLHICHTVWTAENTKTLPFGGNSNSSASWPFLQGKGRFPDV